MGIKASTVSTKPYPNLPVIDRNYPQIHKCIAEQYEPQPFSCALKNPDKEINDKAKTQYVGKSSFIEKYEQYMAQKNLLQEMEKNHDRRFIPAVASRIKKKELQERPRLTLMMLNLGPSKKNGCGTREFISAEKAVKYEISRLNMLVI